MSYWDLCLFDHYMYSLLQLYDQLLNNELVFDDVVQLSIVRALWSRDMTCIHHVPIPPNGYANYVVLCNTYCLQYTFYDFY